MTLRADGVLFDKDGTLFDFHATWSVWTLKLIETLSAGQADIRHALAKATRFDLTSERFHNDSPIIAGTPRHAAEAVASVLTDRCIDDVERFLNAEAQHVPLVEAAPLVPLLALLNAWDLTLGVMTNDSEAAARAHLGAVGVTGMFDFIAGSDSGFGAKPAPGPLLAFARAHQLYPSRVVMVGDSTQDLKAGRAAGMQTVGVLTGPATESELTPYADAVLPTIGHLPTWLEG